MIEKIVPEAINIYPYGSRVYKTNSETSDYDYIVIANNSCDQITTSVEGKEINISIYSVEQFESMVSDHHISALECLFLSKDLIIKSTHQFDFQLDIVKLRNSISQKASHSWVKAKKKIDKEKDLYIGKKSLYHSLRIIEFGYQIATKGCIDYSSTVELYHSIMSNQAIDWFSYSQEWKSIYNCKMTEFRKVAPK